MVMSMHCKTCKISSWPGHYKVHVTKIEMPMIKELYFYNAEFRHTKEAVMTINEFKPILLFAFSTPMHVLSIQYLCYSVRVMWMLGRLW